MKINTLYKLFSARHTHAGNMMIRNGDNHTIQYSSIANPYTCDAVPGDALDTKYARNIQRVDGDLDMRDLRIFVNGHLTDVAGSLWANGAMHVQLRNLRRIDSNLDISDTTNFCADNLATIGGNAWVQSAHNMSLNKLQKINGSLIVNNQSAVVIPGLESVDGNIFASNITTLKLPNLASVHTIYAIDVHNIDLPKWSNGRLYVDQHNIPARIHVGSNVNITYGVYRLSDEMIRSAIDSHAATRRTSANLNSRDNNNVCMALNRTYNRIFRMVDHIKKR